MQSIPGLAGIRERFDAVLVDAWGVLHDGAAPYPAARACLERLRGNGTPVVVVSNAARRAGAVERELRRVGLAGELFHGVVSSGELTWRALRDGATPVDGKRAYYLGPARSRSICDGLDLHWRESAEDCDFVVNAGAPRGNPANVDALRPMLARLRERELPMICANPDRIAVRAGVPGISAGAIAEAYRELGGRLICYGKPGGEIFASALALLPGIDASRVLMAGDAFETDILGAARHGLASLLIAGGIHARDLAPPGPQSVGALAARYRVEPDYYCDLFRWER